MQYTLNKHGPRDGPNFSYQLSAVSYQWVNRSPHSALRIPWENRSLHSALRTPWENRSQHSALSTQWDTTSSFVSPSPPPPLTHSWKSFPWQIDIADGYSSTSHLEYPGRIDNDRLSRPPGNVVRDGESRNEFRESGEICISHSASRTPWVNRTPHFALRTPWDTTSYDDFALRLALGAMPSALCSIPETKNQEGSSLSAQRFALRSMSYALCKNQNQEPGSSTLCALRSALCLKNNNLKQLTKNT